jgi:hypothetical protein
MSEDGMRIERHTNGYEISIKDPKIVAENRKPSTPYREPWKTYVYATAAEVAAFVTKNIDKLPTTSDFGTAFDCAVKEEDD